MHHALHIPEILLEILQLFSWRSTLETVEKRTLFNSALVCRQFQRMSLDQLWKHMDDLTPLFRLLSHFKMPQDESKMGEICGPISESECVKFGAYARRIRSYAKRRSERIALSAYIHVLQATNQLCLLPELKTLRVSTRTSEDEILLLISPSLQKAYFRDGHSRKSHVDASVHSLQMTARSLTCLDIWASFTAASLRSIGSMRRLKKLNITHWDTANPCGLDLDFLLDLASSDTLENLDIYGFQLNSSRPKPLHQVITFPALTLCKWTGLASVGVFLDFIQNVNLPKLVEIDLKFEGSNQRDRSDWASFFHTLPTFASHLRSIELGFAPTSRSSPWESPELPFHNFECLSSCDLTSLVIVIPIFSEFSSDQIIAILSCWRNLKTLTFRPRLQALPFQVLVWIGQTLSKLRYLSLDIDASVLPAVDSVPILDHSLVQLSLCGDLGEPWDLARLIDRIFPRLDDIECMAQDSEDTQDYCYKMRQLLEVCISVRSDERKRCQAA
ncbi:unnamed protein product [Cyclocybe aegerita]|uniref:F-box domain-containing protein n=1 Tax=Cyclocybe aegerita TaxID=1973307 RepID=A0A8S0VQQ0_CYCAE|nr:unnamed protein product [Cyclocybe aegerita]